MRREWLLLIFTLVLGVSVAAWVLLGDDTAGAVANDVDGDNTPARVNRPVDRREFTPEPETNTSAPISEYRVAKDADIPAPPKVVNDPNQGAYWLRLIDDATGEPIANTEFETFWIREFGDFSTKSTVSPDENSFDPGIRMASRTSDERGCVEFLCEVNLKEEFDRRNAGARKHGLKDLPYAVPFLVGVPVGWMMVADSFAMQDIMLDLLTTPKDVPIDVRCRATAKLSGRVTLADGSPVSKAMVSIEPLRIDERYHPWLAFHNSDLLETYRQRMELDTEGQAADVVLRDRSSEVWIDGVPAAWNPDYGALGEWTPRDNLPEEEDEYDTDSDLLDYPADCHSDKGGGYELAPMVPGLYRVTVTTATHGVQRRDVTVEVDSTSDFVFDEARSGVLEIRLTWNLSPEEAESAKLPPEESWTYGICDFQYRHSGESVVHHAAVGVGNIEGIDVWPDQTQTFSVRGLAPGEWSFLAKSLFSDDEFNPRYKTIVKAGETTVVNIVLGDALQGRWKPVFMWGEDEVEMYPTFKFQRNDGMVLDAEKEDDAYALPAGKYSVWLSDGWVHEFEIEWGETLEERIDVPLQSVKITLDPQLHEILTAGNEEVLFVLGQITENERYEMADALAEHVEEELETDFDENGQWSGLLPVGVYELVLDGSFEFHVPIVVKRGQNIDRTITLDDVVGMYWSRVEMVGFQSHHELDHDFTGSWLLEMDASILAYRQQVDETSHVEIHHRAHVSYGDLDWIEVKNDASGRVAYAFYATPSALLRMYLYDDKTDEDATVYRTIHHRKTLAVTPNDFRMAGDFPKDSDGNAYSLKLTSSLPEADEARFDVAVGPNGGSAVAHERGITSGDPSRMMLEPGDYAVTVVRRREGEEPTYATTSVFITQGRATTLDVAPLTFRELGRLEIKLLNALDGLPKEEAISYPEEHPSYIEALDGLQRGQAVAPFNGRIGNKSQAVINRKVKDLRLLPGRYRLVPWKGASAEACREFTITSGGVTKLTFDASAGR